MGFFQDEALSDALKLAFAAGMLSSSMPHTIPVQVPLVLFAPPTCYDLMNLMTTKPFTTFNPPQTTKTLRPSYVAIPLYTIFPVYGLQGQGPPPQLVPSAFLEVVRRTAELSAYGAVALAWLLSQIANATPKKNLDCFRDDQQPSCDLLDLSSLPPTPTEDDLLRVDMSALESIPSSELYGEAEPVTEAATAPRLLPTETRPPSCLQTGSSNATLVNGLGGFLSGENLSALLQTHDDELYFNFEDLGKLGATPPWQFNSPAFTAPALPPT